MAKVNIPACLAEFLAMTLFVIIGCGSAMGIKGSTNEGVNDGGTTSLIPGWVLMVSLSFGLAITVLAYTVGHISGGQINCAVTLGLVLVGELPLLQGVANLVSQLLGSLTGAGILCLIFPASNDHTNTLGSNGVGDAWAWNNALVAEIFGTFLLMTVVLQTAVNANSEGNRAQACIAIGLAVFCAHVVLIPIDGCSINPTRSFGPAVVATIRGMDNLFQDMWIFWVGPLVGAALAAGLYILFDKLGPKDAYTEGDEESD